MSVAQNLTQTIKGQIIDKQSQQGLPGATVFLLNSNPQIGSTSDDNGYFKLTNVPIGRVSIQVSYIGYQTTTLNNLYLTSAKELVLNIEVEEKVQAMDEVTVTANRSKSQPINDMALISARSFTIEETEKYAGSRGDVARMASNYAGVSFTNDSRNDIVIRGNSPSGLLWRLEDVDVPNPNHFAENGTTGGPVGMLNNNVLKNSDFFTGAFPAEYGNALSGVFDLKMRSGNNEKHEFIAQCGFNGFELGAEGPINRATKSSYLVNYRYSTLELMNKMGFDFGTAGVPEYQDINYKVVVPTKKGLFTLFGIAGLSEINMLDSKQTGKELYTSAGTNLKNFSGMASSGLSYTHYFNNKTYAKFIVSGLFQEGGTNIDTINIFRTSDTIPLNAFRYLTHKISESRGSVSMITGTKFSSQLSSKAGFTIDRMGYNLSTEMYDNKVGRLTQRLSNKKDLSDGDDLYRMFYEISYKITDQFTVNPGIQLMYFNLNKQTAIEPRFSVSWTYSDNKKINIGYGMHSRMQALSTYYIGTITPTNEYVETNKNLGFTKSHQFVVGHDWNISDNIRFKTEAYYQDLYDIPVEQRSTSFSLINSGAYWGVGAEDSLVNKGTGKNYGVEFTLEKFFNKGYYFLLTSSIFDSKYKGSDGIERNTAYNGNYVINALVGKEFQVTKRFTINTDLKFSYAGGKRYTPIDTANSSNFDFKYIDSETFAKQFPEFFKLDVKVGLRLNCKRVSHEWQFYVENITNHKNFLQQNYVYNTKEINGTIVRDNEQPYKLQNVYQLGFFPMVLYRINF
jgi:hypothetical protein